jgi:hypothetical protein
VRKPGCGALPGWPQPPRLLHPAVQPPIPRYNDEEYRSLIKKEAGWSREETDYLLELCERFELRFVAIADRYEVRCGEVGAGRLEEGHLVALADYFESWHARGVQCACVCALGGCCSFLLELRGLTAAVRWVQRMWAPPCPAPSPLPTKSCHHTSSLPFCPSAQFPGAPERSIEDLKARYYGVARQLLVGREGGPESVANSVLVRLRGRRYRGGAGAGGAGGTEPKQVPPWLLPNLTLVGARARAGCVAVPKGGAAAAGTSSRPPPAEPVAPPLSFPQVRHPFNAQHEAKRKRGLELLMRRSRDQDAAEDEVLQRAAAIEAKRKAEAAAKRGSAGPAAGAAAGSQGAAPPSVREVRCRLAVAAAAWGRAGGRAVGRVACQRSRNLGVERAAAFAAVPGQRASRAPWPAAPVSLAAPVRHPPLFSPAPIPPHAPTPPSSLPQHSSSAPHHALPPGGRVLKRAGAGGAAAV